MWRFDCKKYPQLTVCVGDCKFITFSAGIFETDDNSVAEVLKTVPDITLVAEPKQEEPQPKKTTKKTK